MQKMKLDHLLTPHTRINSKWIKVLNVRPETIKIVEENIGSKISDIAHSNILSNISPQARKTKEKKKQNKWDCVKLKSILHSKGKQQIERQPKEWENIFADTSDKGLVYKIDKVLTKLDAKKPQTTQLKNRQRTWIDTSPKRTYRWPTDIWKDAQRH